LFHFLCCKCQTNNGRMLLCLPQIKDQNESHFNQYKCPELGISESDVCFAATTKLLVWLFVCYIRLRRCSSSLMSQQKCMSTKCCLSLKVGPQGFGASFGAVSCFLASYSFSLGRPWTRLDFLNGVVSISPEGRILNLKWDWDWFQTLICGGQCVARCFRMSPNDDNSAAQGTWCRRLSTFNSSVLPEFPRRDPLWLRSVSKPYNLADTCLLNRSNLI